MAKKKRQSKSRGARSMRSRKSKRKKSAKPKLTLKQRLARARKLEALDAGKPVSEVARERALESQPQTRGTPSVVITDSVGRWEKNASNLPADVKTVHAGDPDIKPTTILTADLIRQFEKRQLERVEKRADAVTRLSALQRVRVSTASYVRQARAIVALRKMKLLTSDKIR
jgi:hypothetical protein